MKDRLTKQQAFATGNNQDIIEWILWENNIDPTRLSTEEYKKYVEIIYKNILAEQN